MIKGLVPEIPPGGKFRRLICSRLLAYLGTFARPVLLTLTVLRSGGSARELSLVLTLGAIPEVIALFFSGHIVQRSRPGRVIVAGDLINAAAALAAGLAVAHGHLNVRLLAVSAVAGSVSSGLLYPAYGTLITQMVDKRHLRQANSLRSLIGSGTSIIGPAAAGLAMTVLPATVPWLFTAGLYLAGAALVSGVPGTRSDTSEGGSLADSVKTGWRYFRSQVWLVRLTTFSAVWHMLVWAPLLVLGPLVLRDHYGADSSWGYFEAMIGVGGLVAAGPLSRLPFRKILLPATGGLLGVALVVLLFAVPVPLVVLIAAGALVGAGLCAAEIFWDTAMQTWIPEEQLPNMLSYDNLVSVALLPLGLALAPVFAAGLSLTGALLTGAAVTIGAAALALADPQVRLKSLPGLRLGAANEMA